MARMVKSVSKGTQPVEQYVDQDGQPAQPTQAEAIGNVKTRAKAAAILDPLVPADVDRGLKKQERRN